MTRKECYERNILIYQDYKDFIGIGYKCYVAVICIAKKHKLNESWIWEILRKFKNEKK